VLETFMALEKEFNLKISDEDAEKLTTVGSVIDYITAHARRF
jgi:acyl carrier protein